jgi:hypothetical protein
MLIQLSTPLDALSGKHISTVPCSHLTLSHPLCPAGGGRRRYGVPCLRLTGILEIER